MPPRRVPIRILPGCRGKVPAAEVRRIARRVLAAENVAPAVEVDIVLADADTMQELNRLYRGKDEPTDILSFASMDEDAFVEAPDEVPGLGEIVICVPVAEAQAAAAGRPLAGEVAHLLVHGLLHVLGIDHEESEAEEARMQAREDELLGELGYAGQYAHGH